MKQRHLRPQIQTALEIALIPLLITVGSISDFELKAIPFIFLLLTLMFGIGYILNKYGKYEDTEEPLK